MKTVKQLEGYIVGELATLKLIMSIMKLEARLAGLSIVPLLLNLCLLFIVLITLWLLGMVVLVYFLSLFFQSALPAIFLVLLLNGLFFIVLIAYLLFNVRKMSFEKTRKCISNLRTKDDHEREKGSHD